MPVFSAFTACGFLEFSSEPSEAEKMYEALRHSYDDPRTGRATIDTTEGTHQEAKIYGWAGALGAARVTLRAAGNELRPETSYAQLEAHEAKFRMSPAATDTVAMRRVALGAKQKAARGPRFEAVVEALSAIYGSLFVKYCPTPIADAEAYPEDPGASATPGLFRRPDAIAKSVRILDAVSRCSDVILCDTYALSNRSSASLLSSASRHYVGQSFTGDGKRIGLARFGIAYDTVQTSGPAYAKIYAHTGVFGTSSLPTGEALATSEPFETSVLTTTYALHDFSFTGDNQIELESGTNYFLSIEFQATGTLGVGSDNSAPTHGGNGAFDSASGGAWTAISTRDYIFDVVTGYRMQVAYENWNRSLVEIALVKGDVLVVDPGNWGLAEKLIIVDAEGEGDERKFTAAFRRPHSADVFATTGPVPLWSNSKRHVLVVVTAAAAVDPSMVARTNELFRRIMRGPTTWAIVQPTTAGAATAGPFKIGGTLGSPLGAVPLESVAV
jgi:hypothetical protein